MPRIRRIPSNGVLSFMTKIQILCQNDKGRSVFHFSACTIPPQGQFANFVKGVLQPRAAMSRQVHSPSQCKQRTLVQSLTQHPVWATNFSKGQRKLVLNIQCTPRELCGMLGRAGANLPFGLCFSHYQG